MQESDEAHYAISEIISILEDENFDQLRGAGIQAFVQAAIGTIIFFFVFFNSGTTVQIVGSILLFLVYVGTFSKIRAFIRYTAYDW